MHAQRRSLFVHPLLAKIQAQATSQIELADSSRYVVDIDSDLALAMLEHRPESQRRPDELTIKRYARDMMTGAWRADLAEPFTFDVNLSFINGQHRANGIVAASAKAPFVLRNASVVVLKTDAKTMALPLDCGKRRTRQNYERSIGVEVPKTVSAGLLYESVDFIRSRINGLSLTEQAKIVAEHPFRERVLGIRKISRHPAGVVAGVTRCVRVAGAPAVEFFEHVFENDHTIGGAPSVHVRLLATWLFDVARRKYAGDAYLHESTWRTITAWNEHRVGKHRQIAPKYTSASEIPGAMP